MKKDYITIGRKISEILKECGIVGNKDLFFGKPSKNNKEIFTNVISAINRLFQEGRELGEYEIVGEVLNDAWWGLFHYANEQCDRVSELEQQIRNIDGRVSPVLVLEYEQAKANFDEVSAHQHTISAIKKLLTDELLVSTEDGLELTDIAMPSMDTKEMSKLMEYHSNHLAEAIVDKKGTVYAVYKNHRDTIPYLIALGVDLEGAVRVNSIYKDLVFSSLHSFEEFDTRFESDKVIYLTEAQATSLYDFYESYYAVKGKNKSLYTILRCSSNFGYSLVGKQKEIGFYDDSASKHNLDMFLRAVFAKYPIDKFNKPDQSIGDLYDREIEDSNRLARMSFASGGEGM